ncbi:H(+)/Cl(-) exchange transporter 7 [Desmophyllum pertusum]|uniref:Chloride channel protein n=1 Tax=Desmophyllum pertusum TaxID=174260 RepID=A0A9W9YHU9_9CNID|nr:H(+)/Cl(-) exchange transporter 7 [Desmophyllum pertusum]
MQRSQRMKSVSHMTTEDSPLLSGEHSGIQPKMSRRRNTTEGSANDSQLESTNSRENVSIMGSVTEPGSLQKISSKYESLDYDTAENTLYFKEQKSYTPEERLRININRWVIMFIIGFVTAVIAFAIDISILLLANQKYTLIKKYIDRCTSGDCMSTPFSLWVALDVLFVLIAAVLVVYGEPVAAGSGIPQIKCYLNGVLVPHVVRMKTLVCKVVGVVFSVAGGLACGKEGPMIHAGAVVAAGVSQGRSTTFNKDFKMFEYFRQDHEKRDFVSGGAAAGVSAAFGAPIGGVLFSLEEGASFWNQSLTWRMFFASMVSTFTLNVLLSIYRGDAMDLSNPGLINFGTFEGQTYSSYEIPLFCVMAIVGGLLGALFNAINHHLCIFRMRFVKKNWVRVIEVLIVAVMSTTTAFVLIYFYQDCKPIGAANISRPLQFFCEDGQYSAMGTLVFSTPEESIKNLFHLPETSYHVATLAGFAPAYFLLATWTYGLFVPSGLFVPCILTGAAWGRLWGVALKSWFPAGHWGDAGSYALIGAAATLGGVVRMTISLTVILMEATGNISFGIPIMIVLMIAKWVGDFFNEGLYDIHIKLQGVPLLGWDAPVMAVGMNVSDIMSRKLVCFKSVEKDKTSHHNGFPVVDYLGSADDEDPPASNTPATFGTVRGLILRSQLIILLKQKVSACLACRVFIVYTYSPRVVSQGEGHKLKLKDFRDAYPRFPPIRNVSISQKERECYIDLRPFMNPSPYTVNENSSLLRVFKLFRALGLRHIVAVNEYNEVVGMVTRKDIARYRMWSHRGQIGLEEVHILEASSIHDSF